MNPHRILIVEDKSVVAMKMASQVKAMGYEPVGVAVSGEQTLALTEERQPDLILMGIRLEGEMDGIAAALEIRQRFQKPVVFLTACSDDATLERAKLAEPFGYLIKPIDNTELKSAIEIALYKHQAEQELHLTNRFYNVLIHLNQKIIRRQSREELLQTVCRLLVEHGAVDLAWIGWLEPASSRILPLTHFGKHGELLRQSEFSTQQGPDGPANPSKAIREGKLFVCNSCQGPECLYPVNEQAPFGSAFHSCAAFPLRFMGEVCGSLNICVAKPGFFQEKEVTLLEEVATDISFALDLIESDCQRNREAEERKLTTEVLELINAATDSPSLLSSVLAHLKTWSGCEAAGIRLHDGYDFPYFETSGFPEHFVRLENHLCSHDAQGEVVRGADGNPVLDCMCGNIIRGRVNPAKSFFTTGGSFWSNCTTHLLATTTDADRQARTRNRCNGEGYESVALIPLRSSGRTFGLLQLNDKRKGQFTLEKIALLERLSQNIANFLDKMQLTAKLQEGEAQLRSIGDNLPGSYIFQYTHDEGGKPRFLFVSAGVTRIHGVTPEEVLADAGTLHGQIEPSQIEARRRAEARSAAELIDFAMDLHMRRPDGDWRWLHVRSRPRLRQDGLVIWDGAATDITDRKLADEQLRKLSTTVEQTPAMVVITNLQGRIEYVNPAFTAVTGYTPAEVINKNPRILKSNETPIEVYQDLWGTITKGREWRGVLHNRRKDGTLFWERDVISPLRDEDGGITHFIAVKEDITAQKSLEDQLRQVQKMEAIGTLAGGIAHDFNNILAVILGYADLAREATPDSSICSEYIEKIMTAGYRARDLVKQILTFSRQTQVKRQPLQPQPIIKEALKMLRATIPTTIAIKADISPHCGTIAVDPTQLHQIMINLCSNAYHAMEKSGGVLRIELKTADCIPTELRDKAGTGFVELSVGDTGPGIDRDIIDKIFDPFFTTKEPGKGTGMGLSIVHGIVRDYGGSITVDSQEGKGSTFHVYIPQMGEDMALTPDFTVVDVPGGKERILYIDDEVLLCNVAGDMLKTLGYDVTTEQQAFEALALFRRQPEKYDLVITDLTMPGITGLELASRMMRIRTDIPVILCTGHSSLVNEEVARSQGIKEFALKPLTRSAIAKLIRQALAGTERRPPAVNATAVLNPPL